MEAGNCITSPIVREYVKYKGDIEYDKIYTEQILYGKVNNDTSVVRPVSYFIVMEGTMRLRNRVIIPIMIRES